MKSLKNLFQIRKSKILNNKLNNPLNYEEVTNSHDSKESDA